ncbi:DUF2062 domain-containing protein [Desulfotomaculum sp. 1211_IL3151]|uniref:DUF2062 domain-containing protein n=1 Tax=Desulfotomaculum sp. 1211_IL3151 TaxID=3084055 RepID=UPI002FDA6B5B
MIFKKYKERFFKLISIRDCPYKLAKSISLGFFLALLPLPGLNLAVGVILAKLFRLNVVATTIPAVLLTYVSPFLYYFNYKTGALFIHSGEKPPQEFVYDLSFWEKIANFFAQAGPAYLLGSAINATLAAFLSYFIFLYFYKKAFPLFVKKIGLWKVRRHIKEKDASMFRISNWKNLK